jgi:hypothetical protein
MGRDRHRILDRTAPHFVTCTVLEWPPLFARPANVQIPLAGLGVADEQLEGAVPAGGGHRGILEAGSPARSAGADALNVVAAGRIRYDRRARTRSTTGRR